MYKPKGPGVARIPRTEDQLYARGSGTRFTPAEMLAPLAAYKNIFGEYPKMGRKSGWRPDHAENAWSQGIQLCHPSAYLKRFGGYHAACVAADYWYGTGPALDVDDLSKERTKESMIDDMALVLLAIGNGPVRDEGSGWHPRVQEGADRIGVSLACPRIYGSRFKGIREAAHLSLLRARQLQAEDWDGFGHVDLSDKMLYAPRSRQELIDIFRKMIDAVGIEKVTARATAAGWNPAMLEAAQRLNIRLPTPNTYRHHFGSMAEARRIAQEAQ
jgi:hypothetical protein